MMERALEAAPGAVESNPEGYGRAAERARRLRWCQAVPGDKGERLPVVGGETLKGASDERIAGGALERRRPLVREPVYEAGLPLCRATLVGERPPSRADQPRQHILRQLVEAPP